MTPPSSFTSIAVVLVGTNIQDLTFSLHSIDIQDTPPSELIIVIDGEESAVPNDLLKRPSPVHVYFTGQRSGGPSRARNLGVTKSSSDFVAFLDNGDQFSQDKLTKLFQLIHSKPQVDFITNGVQFFVDGKPAHKFCPSFRSFYQLIRSNSLGGAPALCMKRSFFMKIGGFNCHLKMLEDYDLNLKAIQHNAEVAIIPERLTLAYYSTKSASVSRNLDSIHSHFLSIQENNFQIFNSQNRKAIELFEIDLFAKKSLYLGLRSKAIFYCLKNLRKYPLESLKALIMSVLGLKLCLLIRRRLQLSN